MKEPDYTHEIKAKRPVQLISHDAKTLLRGEFTYVEGITEEDRKQEGLGAITITPLKRTKDGYVHVDLDEPEEEVVKEAETETKVEEKVETTSTKAKTPSKSRGKRSRKKN